MTTLEIRLSDEMVREIDRLAGEAGQERDQFITDVLRRQIDLARGAYGARMDADSFEMVRERLRPYAERAGYTREADILDDES